ncbi:MAG: 3-phosphoglycerate dehydrogenase family protein [Gammaproteobacteria bacterium]|nr:3-phosphoglycerate dehydrogenase family protein [Gammaproteobacteria bacterium]
MFKVLTLNNISTVGLNQLPRNLYEVASEIKNPDAIMVRSHPMHEMGIPSNLKVVGRAGAGVNNIPVEAMTQAGIPVFNAPGANANAVKELVIASLFLASRNLCQAYNYTVSLKGESGSLKKKVEAGKKQFVGFELPGKTLGVIGLGAIGVLVANAASSLGMNVIGFDPGITVSSAWNLSSNVEKGVNVDDVLSRSDFVTVHVPLLDSTRHLIDQERLEIMKDGVILLNFARDGILNDSAVCQAINAGKVSTYVTDFPSAELIGHPGVITLPHLGASTHQAEENCAVMVANQIRDFLENGNITNAVNFPTVNLPRASDYRVAVVNENRPDMVSQISHVLGKTDVNIKHMINESRGDIAYTLMDTDSNVCEEAVDLISAIDGVLRVYCL